MTSSDYVWDKSGSPEPWIEELERTLAPLRFEPLAGVPPQVQVRPKTPVLAEPAPRRVWVPVVAGLSTAAAVLLIAAGISMAREDTSAEPLQQQADTPSVVSPAGTPDVAGVVPNGVTADAVESKAETLLIFEETTEETTEETPEETTEETPTERPATEPDAEPKRSKRKAKTAAASVSKPKHKSKSKVTVDCILDPDKCGGEELPHKLSSSDVKKGVAKVKLQARLCGKKHDVEPGARVKITLSIKGATGRVERARALGSWADTDAGRCVADAIGRAQFPRFSAESMGVVYPVSMLGSTAKSEETAKTKGAASMSRALAPLRTKAKACGVLHDASSGTRVKLKVWFNGKSGAVEASKAMAPHTGTELGKCVAGVVRKGKFPVTGKLDEVALVPFSM